MDNEEGHSKEKEEQRSEEKPKKLRDTLPHLSTMRKEDSTKAWDRKEEEQPREEQERGESWEERDILANAVERELEAMRRLTTLWKRKGSTVGWDSMEEAEHLRKEDEQRKSRRRQKDATQIVERKILKDSHEEDEHEDAHVSSPKRNEEEDEDDQDVVPTGTEVQDADFYDFDSVRQESDIVEGQIWAIYDYGDGMPRFYGRISRVSYTPFKVHLRWLELSPTSEKIMPGVMNSNFFVPCGEFKWGTYAVQDQISLFSHVAVPKTARGLQKIYPRKHEVWAIFSQYNSSQKSELQKIIKVQRGGLDYSLEMVEIVSEFSEGRGVETVRLVKCRGFKTVFQRLQGQQSIRAFQPSELLMFSHRVPANKVTRDIALAHGIPQVEILELDPAAIPKSINLQ